MASWAENNKIFYLVVPLIAIDVVYLKHAWVYGPTTICTGISLDLGPILWAWTRAVVCRSHRGKSGV
mgnify:CR=1 FL=1